MQSGEGKEITNPERTENDSTTFFLMYLSLNVISVYQVEILHFNQIPIFVTNMNQTWQYD